MTTLNNYTQLNNQISDTLRAQGSLLPLKEEWAKVLQKTSAFLDLFLSRFGTRIMNDRVNTPEWKLYSKKTEEYHAYSRAIRNVEYFIAKENLKNV